MTPTTQLSKVSNIKGLRPYYRVNYILPPTEKDAYDDTEINLSIYTEDAEEAYDYDHQLYARKVDEIPGLDGDLDEIVEAYRSEFDKWMAGEQWVDGLFVLFGR